jgi:hypothetical protein
MAREVNNYRQVVEVAYAGVVEPAVKEIFVN